MDTKSASENMHFPQPVHTTGKGVRAVINNVVEAMRFIDDELPAELRARSRWTLARALLIEAERTGKKRDVVCAVRQLKQALSTDDWLAN